MEQANIVLDIILLAMSVWMTRLVAGYGGFIGKAFHTIGWGAIILGVAALLEIITFQLVGTETPLVQLCYRLLILIGFMLTILGFRMLIQDKKTNDN